MPYPKHTQQVRRALLERKGKRAGELEQMPEMKVMPKAKAAMARAASLTPPLPTRRSRATVEPPTSRPAKTPKTEAAKPPGPKPKKVAAGVGYGAGAPMPKNEMPKKMPISPRRRRKTVRRYP